MTRAFALAALFSTASVGLAAQINFSPAGGGRFSKRVSPADVSAWRDSALWVAGYARIGWIDIRRKEKPDPKRTLDALRSAAAEYGGDLITFVMLDSTITEISTKRKCIHRTFWVGNPMSRCDETAEYDRASHSWKSSAAVWRQDPVLARAQAEASQREVDEARRKADSLARGVTWEAVSRAIDAAEKGEEGAIPRLVALLDHGAPVTDSYGASALHAAVAAAGPDAAHQLAVMRLLLARGIPVDIPAKSDLSTPLMWAVYFNRVEAAKFLIDAGADVNAHCLPFRYPYDLRHEARTPREIVYERLMEDPSYRAMAQLLDERGAKR